MKSSISFGVNDATFNALGAQPGINKLIDTFYETMEVDESYSVIWKMHTEDRHTMRSKLSLFIGMWSGGPKDYLVTHGPINIPEAHKHLVVTETERDQWLSCMHSALKHHQYPEDLIEYMMIQLARPAETIRRVCQRSSNQ